MPDRTPEVCHGDVSADTFSYAEGGVVVEISPQPLLLHFSLQNVSADTSPCHTSSPCHTFHSLGIPNLPSLHSAVYTAQLPIYFDQYAPPDPGVRYSRIPFIAIA